jgi:hypothetical protein
LNRAAIVIVCGLACWAGTRCLGAEPGHSQKAVAEEPSQPDRPPLPAPGRPPLPVLDAQVALSPFVLPWDDGSTGPTDLAWLNHKPAGRFGPVTARSDGRLYVGDEPIRFFGVNLCYGANLPEKPAAEKIAARLAKFGINIVRVHHLDERRFPDGIWHRDPQQARTFDPEAVDRLDYLVAQLKANGIYVNLNLLVSRQFSPADGLPAAVTNVTGKAQHLLGMWHGPSLALHQQFARDLLAHTNTYTGLPFAADPSVAFVEILNENGLVNYWFDTKRRPHLHELPDAFRHPLEKRWGGPLLAREGFSEQPAEQQSAWLAFLRAVEADYYRAMRRYLKDELGVAALVIGSTGASSLMSIQAELDVVDNHVYFENPRWRSAPWAWGKRDWDIANVSHVSAASPGGRLRWVAHGRVAGKPYSVTEFNQAAPNVFAGEAPLFLAVHAALQAWDAAYLFAYSHAARWNQQFLSGLDIAEHPTKMVNLLPSALLFRRGDLAPARAAVAATMTPAIELDILARRGSAWNLAHAGHLGLDADYIVRHRMETIVTTNPAAAPPMPPPLSPANRHVSDTGELILDGTEPGRDILIINTPRTKSVFGYFANRTVNLGAVTFRVASNLNHGCCLSLCELPGPPRRAVLVATGRAENTGMQWRTSEREAQTRWELESWGKAPTVVETIAATITLPGPAAALAVHALDERGQRAGRVPVHAAGDQRAMFTIGPPYRTLWYELVWTNAAESHE